MRAQFHETNLYLYHCLRGAAFDGVIWCLGPYVDDSRPYGLPRLVLANATRRLCRWYLRRSGRI